MVLEVVNSSGGRGCDGGGTVSELLSGRVTFRDLPLRPGFSLPNAMRGLSGWIPVDSKAFLMFSSRQYLWHEPQAFERLVFGSVNLGSRNAHS